MEQVAESVVNPFTKPSELSDLILIVEGQRLHISRVVLSLASPVFEKMFFSEFKEKDCSEIPLPDKKYDDMVVFLTCLYPSTCTAISWENVDCVLPLADEYQVESLKQRSQAFLLLRFENKDKTMSDPKNEELIHILYLADRYGFGKLLDVCVELAVQRDFDYGDTSINKTSDYKEMSLETKCEMLSRRVAKLEKTTYAKERKERKESIPKYLPHCGHQPPVFSQP